MLVQLTIRDLGLIEHAELELGEGLQVISGETGVGKSLLLASMSLLRGDRPKTDWIRTGSEEALVAGLFCVTDPDRRAAIEEAVGIELEDGELLIERRLRRQGRHRSRLNGREVTASLLREAGVRLIEIHGQQSQLTLLEPKTQLGLIDDFAGLRATREQYSSEFSRTRELEKEVDTLQKDSEARAERRLSLEHLISEIEAADPRPAERDRLEEELELLEGRDQVMGRIKETLERFHDSEDSLVDQIARAGREFSGLGSRHRDLAEFGALCDSLVGQLEEGLRGLRALVDGLDIDSNTLEEMRRRFDRLVSLEERFRRRGDDLLLYRDELRAELDALGDAEDSLPTLLADLESSVQALQKGAEALTRKRKKALGVLSTQITAELSDLGMERARFRVARYPLTSGRYGGLDAWGADRIEFEFGPNPGEPQKPLAEIASGGELSRVMLSLKRALAEAGSVSTLVFDEIDAGVGGRLGASLGLKLQEIASNRQVLCVTHLAQLACYGANQYRVEKQVSGERTVTAVECLDGERRVEEIATMMRGAHRTDHSIEEAREMLEAAANEISGSPAEGDRVTGEQRC